MSHTSSDLPRSPGLRRGGSALAAVMLTAGAALSHSTPAQAASRVPAEQALIVLLDDHVARARPSVNAPRIETVSARRPLTQVRTVLPVLEEATSSGGRPWAHVRLPGRPNGHSGWILTDRTRRTSTDWRITVRLSARLVTIYRGGLVERRFRAVVGKRSTPTPVGRFFVEEAVALNSRDSGGPFALAISARSNVLQQFMGGPGQIALHGTNHLLGAPGTAVSHGCVRLSADAITWMARRIGAGTPLTVTR